MTPREYDLITFLRQWFAEHEHSPSYAEIAAGLGARSKGDVHRLVHQVAAKGLVSIDPYRARSLRLVGTGIGESRAARQAAVHDWCLAAFGAAAATSLPQRGLRLAEEAIEAAQAAGTPREMLRRLVDYVYDRPAGHLGQELGGVGVTRLALAAAAGLDAEEEEAREVARVLAKPLAHFAKRNAEKNAAGFDAEALAGDGA